MSVKIARAVIDHLGGEEKTRERIAAFTQRLKDHAQTEGVAAPTEAAVIEQLARQYGGEFEIVEPPPDPEPVPTPLPPAPVIEPQPPAAPVEAPPAALATVENVRAAKLAELTAIRRDYQYGGIQYNKIQISSDDGTLVDLLLHVVAAKDDPTYAIPWRIGAGRFVTLTSEDLVAILDRVRAHIQNGVNREERAALRIMNCSTVAELNALDVREVWKKAT